MVSHSLAITMLLVAIPAASFAQAVEPTADETAEATAPTLPPPPAEPPAPVPAQPRPESAPEDSEVPLAEWNSADWELVQPKTALLDLSGYYRLRSDVLRRVNFGNATITEYEMRQPRPRYPVLNGDNADFTGADMRLRLKATINARENIQIVATTDLLDNVILGSTPRMGFATDQSTPLNILSRGQETVTRGENAVTDSIAVKHLYAKLTALDEQIELRFGRMPSAFGLGMMANAGDCLNCDGGDIADRIALTFKLADLLFVPMFDWISSGPFFQPFTDASRPGIDAVLWDDAEQYTIQLLKLDPPDDIHERITSGQQVFNFGVSAGWRRQARDLDAGYYGGGGSYELSPALSSIAEDRRNSNVFIGDGYLKWYFGALELGLEGGAVMGSFLHTAAPFGDEGTATVRKVSLNQFGAALEAAWRFSGDYEGTTIGLKSGVATGDSAPGFGAQDYARTQFGHVEATSRFDDGLNNFQFNPAYQIDLLLFNRIIGTVTDAWYVRPEVSALFGNEIGGSLAAIYSQAMLKSSTPNGEELPLGLEFDAELSYGMLGTAAAKTNFKAAIAGGILMPFAGFRNMNLAGSKQNGNFAWTINTRLGVTF